MTNGIEQVYVKQENVDKYLELGYIFGMTKTFLKNNGSTNI